MKKLFLLLLSLIVLSSVFANEHVKVIGKPNLEYHNHETYEVWYDTELKNPSFVIWDLTFEEAKESDAAKSNRAGGNFPKCKSAPRADYSAYNKSHPNARMDRGHMCPNNDRDWSKEASKNTFRGCNVCPQLDSLNRGEWQTFERYGHELAYKHMLVTIVCGPIYYCYTKDKSLPTKVGESVLPEEFFKVFIWDGKIRECYVFSNKTKKESAKKTSIEDIERRTGLSFETK